jgi:S-formylglutathione hydrolase
MRLAESCTGFVNGAKCTLTISTVVILLCMSATKASGDEADGGSPKDAECLTTLKEGIIMSDLVPYPIHYGVLLPPYYRSDEPPLPLIVALPGGGKQTWPKKGWEYLKDLKAPVEALYRENELPRMVFASPNVDPFCDYLDYRDGSQRWESFILKKLLPTLRSDFNISSERNQTLLLGGSMGGVGVLRLGFKYPQQFGAVAALEPGVAPVLRWRDVPQQDLVFNDDHFETLYGKPFDETYWEENNPASIVVANPDRLRGSDLLIYIECGNRDVLNLFEGAEFLHRILWDREIEHEYHSVHGANHLGPSLARREREALAFLGRSLDREAIESESQIFRKAVEKAKAEGGLPGASEEMRWQYDAAQKQTSDMD